MTAIRAEGIEKCLPCSATKAVGQVFNVARKAVIVTHDEFSRAVHEIKAAPEGSRFKTLFKNIRHYCGIAYDWVKKQAERFLTWLRPKAAFWGNDVKAMIPSTNTHRHN